METINDTDETPRGNAFFVIEMTPAEPLLDGTARFDFSKTWRAVLEGTSAGVILSAGDPVAGSAGYVALETVDGVLDGRAGTFVLQQCGTMTAGSPTLTYAVVPGSATGELVGLQGTVEILSAEGEHEVQVSYSLG